MAEERNDSKTEKAKIQIHTMHPQRSATHGILSKSKEKKTKVAKISKLSFYDSQEDHEHEYEQVHPQQQESRNGKNRLRLHPHPYRNQELEEEEEEERYKVTEIDPKRSNYDLHSLQQLKAEQKVYTMSLNKEETEPEITLQSSHGDFHAKKIKLESTDPDTIQKYPSQESQPNVMETMDFLPFPKEEKIDQSVSTSTWILNGEDAFQFEKGEEPSQENKDSTSLFGKRQEMNHSSHDCNRLKEEEDDEENLQWEHVIARRGGILPPLGHETQTRENQDRRVHAQKDESEQTTRKNIQEIQQTLQSTLVKLDQQQNHIRQELQKQKMDLDTAQQEYLHWDTLRQTHQDKVKFYQSFLFQSTHFIPFLGALRELNNKLDTVEQSLQLIYYGRITMERKLQMQEYEQDLLDILCTHGVLDTVVGRTKDKARTQIAKHPNTAHTTTQSNKDLDEFGRDLQSLTCMERKKRKARRIQAFHDSECRRNRSHNHFRSTGEMHLDTDQSKDLHQLTLQEPEQVLDGDRNNHSISFILQRVQSQYEDSEYDLDDEDLLDREQRRMALTDAVQLVLNEIDDNYTSISNLIHIFIEWMHLYPEDYDQTFANFSLAEMIAVLARLEFCRTLDLMGFVSKGHSQAQSLAITLDDFQWFQQLQHVSSSVHESTSSSRSVSVLKFLQSLQTLAVDLIIRTTCIPDVLAMLKPIPSTHDGETYSGGYDWSSRSQSQRLSSFYSSLVKNLSNMYQEEYRQKLANSLIDHLTLFIDEKLTFLTHPSHIGKMDWFSSSSFSSFSDPERSYLNDDKNTAILYATFGQLYFWKKVVYNVTTYWSPVLQDTVDHERMARIMFREVFSNRVLKIVSLFDQIEKTVLSEPMESMIEVIQESRHIVLDMIHCVESAGWFDSMELMIDSAPLRAVRHRYTYVT